MSLSRIKGAFAIFKTMVTEFNTKLDSQIGCQKNPLPNAEHDVLIQQIKDLKSLLAQRDSEINILVNMVKKGKQIDVASDADAKVVVKEIGLESTDKPTIHTKTVLGDVISRKESKSDKNEVMIKKHLFGVPPPTDAKVFEDAAGMSY